MIKIFRSAAKEEVMHLEQIIAIRRCSKVEQTTAAISLQLTLGIVVEDEGTVHPGVNCLGGAFGQNPLTFPRGKSKEIEGAGMVANIDHCPYLDLHHIRERL